MANISQYLAAIMSAIYGRDVRSSIHDAIREINTAQEQAINAGTAIVDGDPAGGVYDKSYYFNTATNDLLECDGTTWNIIDNLEGNAITSITGPVTDLTNPLIDVYTIHFSKIADRTFIVNNGKGISSITGPVVDPSTPLTDVYTINFNDGTSLPYSVENGRGIVSIDGPASVGLLDTYTINFNDGTTQPFIVTNGKDGKTWYRGIKVYGKVVRDTVFNDSGILNAQEGDFYLNYSEGAIYHCTLGGAPTVATWLYDFTISGGGSSGAQKLDDLDDVAIDATSLGNKQILIYDATAGQWVNANPPVVDQTFDGTSANAQSGKAVKEAVDKNYSTEDTAETDIADDDYFPFYDTSAPAKKKSLWSNIKDKLSAVFALLSIVGTVENGTTASQAYAAGQHFVKDGYFCTAIADIQQGATLTLNTNYMQGNIAGLTVDYKSIKDSTSSTPRNWTIILNEFLPFFNALSENERRKTIICLGSSQVYHYQGLKRYSTLYRTGSGNLTVIVLDFEELKAYISTNGAAFSDYTTTSSQTVEFKMLGLL